MRVVVSGDDVEEDALSFGDELGRGGQGSVFRVTNPENVMVYKMYRVTGADGEALRRLVRFPASLPTADQDLLLRQTAWPLARVMHQGQVNGFLMQAIPERFYGANAAGRMRERQVQYLMFQPRPVWGDIVAGDVTVSTRLDVAYQCARLIHLLHANSLVLGDISMSNILWAPGGPATIFLLDCDGIRERGCRAVFPQAETPDWIDPLRPDSGPDRDTDRYKLALLIGRILARDPYLTPPSELRLMDRIPNGLATEVQVLWLQAARPHGNRPDASRWLAALGGGLGMPDV